ncbi:MAG: hypothetical protein AAFQ82_04410, partial [Myxococcota bacterium]
MNLSRYTAEPRRVFAWARIGAALSLLHYNLTVIVPRFFDTFGAESIVDPAQFVTYLRSPVFLVWSSPGALLFLYAVFLLTLVCFAVGLFARVAHIVALLLALAFHHANPFIIHEPQQLGILLLWVLLFVPYESHLVVRRTPGFAWLEDTSPRYDQVVCALCVGYISAYYFFAGVKKLPDPAWIKGHALFDLLHWEPLRLDSSLARALRSQPGLSRVANYGAL